MPALDQSWSFRKVAPVLLAGFVGCAIGTNAQPLLGDDFSRIVGAPLFDITTRPGTVGTTRLTIRTIESLPEVVRGERSALIVATTDEGNLAKLLVSPGLRRHSSAGERPALAPVLILDRFETIDRGDRIARKARGRDLLLFDGFEFDLDTGQVVPAGFGGDIAYSARGDDGPALVAIGKNRLHAIDRPIALPGSGSGRPSTGPAVLPSDFNGRYTLISNGQMSGALELAVADDGAVSGRFRSDRNGTVYPVTGKVAADLPRRVGFEIQFPRSKQAFEGFLWTEDRNVFAGMVQIQEHPYSFLAVREGAPLVPEPIDATSPPRSPMALGSSTRVVTMEGPDRYVIDGVPQSSQELATTLAAAGKMRGPVEVLLRVPPTMPFDSVQSAVQLVRGAGVASIRLAAADAR